MGAPGRDGRDGQPGANGIQGPTGPSGRDGRDGLPAAPGTPGLPGEKGLNGDIGEKGRTGPKGDMGSSGVVYIRWGRTICPNGADRVYHGRAAGSSFNTKGGTSDFLCLPETPQYRTYYSSVSHIPELYGVEYDLDNGRTSLLRQV